jgi:ketosteroid isomerase-like protein
MDGKRQTPGRALYQRQLQYLGARDVDGLVEHQYAEDALLIGADSVVQGREALRAHFRRYLDRLGTLRVDSTDVFVETEDSIFFEASVTSDRGPARVFDAWVLRDGKIARHFTGVM